MYDNVPSRMEVGVVPVDVTFALLELENADVSSLLTHVMCLDKCSMLDLVLASLGEPLLK